jgi:hypothetical protein
MDNAADRKSIRRLEKAAKLAETQRREVITSIMVTSAGRQWLWDRMSECSIFSTTHVPADPYASAFQEGRRSVGLSLLSDIMTHCPDQFILAMREQNERHLSHDAAARADDPSSADSSALAERRGGTLADRGDSGAEPDSSTDPASAEAERGWNPGADIYTPSDPAR